MGLLDKLLKWALPLYMAHVLYTLYGIARPSVPTPAPGEGFVPLYRGRNLTLEVALTLLPSMSKTHLEADVPLLRLEGLTYGWTELEQSIDLRLTLLRPGPCLGGRAPSPNPLFPGIGVGEAEVCPVRGMQLSCVPREGSNDPCPAAAAAAAVDGAPVAASAGPGELLLATWDASGRLSPPGAVSNATSPPSLAVAKVMSILDTAEASVYLQVTLAVDGYTPFPLQRAKAKRGQHRALVVFTPLIVRSAWVEPQVRRSLLRDPTGRAAIPAARANRSGAALPASSLGGLAGVDPRSEPASLLAHMDGPDAPPVPPPGGALLLPPPGHVLPLAGSAWPHFVTDIDVRLLMDTVDLPPFEQLPDLLLQTVRFGEGPAEDSTGAMQRYYVPQLDIPAPRPLTEHLLPLNRTTSVLPLRVRLTPCTYGVGRLLHVLHSAVATQADMGVPEKDSDDVIRLFTEHDMWLLAAVFVISMLHIQFDVLAMRSDLSFWASTTSLKGISVRTLGWQLLSQIVITGYVFTEGASMLVWVPQVGYCLVSLGKYLRGAGLRCGRTKLAGCIPARYPYFDAAFRATASQGPTSVYDAEATSFMGKVLAPLLFGYAGYSLVYQQWTGWWDWGISTAVSIVYAAGFAMMVPQLWINQRLRSVSRLPPSVFVYRAINTFIDDAFAMLVRMPTLHKAAVFRDDVVFICYLVQRWRFPVDPDRPAETFDGDEGEAASGGGEPVAAAGTGSVAAVEEPKKER